MNALVFAILTCTTGSGGICLDNYPIRFRSAEDCLSYLTHNMGHQRELTNGRAYANGSHSVWFECDQKPTSEWETVQSQPAQPEPRSYTVAICTVNGCTQAIPVVHETGVGCTTKLFKNAADNPDKLELDASKSRVYIHGQSHDTWLQCYDTRQQ